MDYSIVLYRVIVWGSFVNLTLILGAYIANVLLGKRSLGHKIFWIMLCADLFLFALILNF